MTITRELGAVASHLGDLRERVVFVGGMVRGLLVTDPAVAAVRPTVDVDIVVDVPSLVAHIAFSDELRRRGFREANEEGAPICRWIIDDVRVDVMPVDPALLGFSNVWYPGAVAQPMEIDTAHGRIRVIDAPHFVATKLEAFASRGGDDYYHHDLEDIIAILDGRPELERELALAPRELRAFLAERAATLLATPNFVEAVPGHLAPDEASQARAGIVFERLRALAAAQGAGPINPLEAKPGPPILAPHRALGRAPEPIVGGSDEWISVRSSNIEAVRYEGATSILLVRFRGGAVDRYEGVPSTIVSGLLGAWSVGRYHHQWIRTRYRYRKVTP